MVTKFEYTAGGKVKSSAVDEVYYNADTQDLLVVLHAGAYVYKGVPNSVYRDLTAGWGSVGRKYAKTVKKNYGPGTYLGYIGDVKINAKAYPAPSMGPVTRVGNPSGLRLAPDAKVTGKQISLRTEDKNAGNRPHTVRFEAGGSLREHTLQAKSVDAAVADINDLADALGVTFKVKEVTVSFV